MALPILDGNQTAATLSTVLTGGEHIPAHTVVSLGSQAITDVRSAVSGSVVSISNFPSTQTIAGTVTARTDLDAYGNSCVVVAFESPAGIQRVANVNGFPIRAMQDQFGTSISLPISGTVTIGNSVTIGSLPAISGTVTVGNSVTIGSLPAISGTVTANVFGKNSSGIGTSQIPIIPYYSQIEFAAIGNVIPVQISNNLGVIEQNNRLPISGTVTANAGSGTFNVSNRGANGVSTVTTVTATSSVTLMASNSNRKLLTIYNEGAGNLHVLYGSGTATTTNYSVKLFSGDYIEIDKYTGQVNSIFATTGTARVTEIT